MKILIVDDFSTMRRIIKNLLRDLGFSNTHEADDGATALPMLKSGDFDFLVTDWNMPGIKVSICSKRYVRTLSWQVYRY
jgi:two-component system chemotaxis response regulator CheY